MSDSPQVRIFHPAGKRRAAGNTKVYLGDQDITDSIMRVEIDMSANDDRPVEVKLTMVGAEIDVTGELAEAETEESE